MPRITFILLLLLLSALPIKVLAQGPGRGAGVMNELCDCMATVDVNGTDKAINAGVRNCMESAVLRHPAEVRALLRHTQGQGSKAFQLGTVLGGALERDCPRFKVVRARLQQMALPQGTRTGT